MSKIDDLAFTPPPEPDLELPEDPIRAAMTVQAAIRTVARDLIDKVVVAARDTDNMWEWYPEIGEHDWERVTDHVEAYLSVNLRQSREQFDAAYALLTERAL